MNRLLCIGLVAALPWCLSGCQNSAQTAPAQAKVSGTVNVDGKPMESGQILFNVGGQAPRTLEVKNGAFSGEVFTGKNRVEVVLLKEGPPNPMDPKTRIQVNSIAPEFWGPNTTLHADVTSSGATGLQFDVRSAR
ncbi:MAG: hypothetical protein J2P46_11255 [Zavarzinella sp.]|nr:hypothetical protein [Zavarzinella sp.]